MSRSLGVALALLVIGTVPAFAQELARPRDLMVYTPDSDVIGVPAATTNTIFLNRCTGGCQVTHGGNDGTQNPALSTIGQGTLSAFVGTDQNWSDVVACMRDVYADFNVNITDQKPSGDYLTIMIAGTSDQIGEPSNVLGVAPYNCNEPFQDRALVFVFANDSYYNNGTSTNELCATAAQEIAHTWTLDHSTDAADPMTYFSYGMRRYYANSAQQCGSDCVNGRSPFGYSCTGTNNQDHQCTCTGSQTENSYQTVMNTFGPGNPTPPTVMITNPLDGQAVQPGFNVTAQVNSVYGTASKADLYVDGNLVLTLTSQPFAFNAPSSLGTGPHTVKVIGYDNHGMSSTQITAIIGQPCTKPGDCPVDTDTCVGGRCVAGPGVQGGLGTTCTQNGMCSSGECASDSTGDSYCVEPCEPGQCPSGFGCLPVSGGSDSTAGVCWPGYNDGKGGCSSSGGPIGLGLGFAALLFVRRRRA